MTLDQLLTELVSLPPSRRDAEVERLLGVATPGGDDAPPGAELIGYHASGLAPVLRALREAPVTSADVFIDLGSGLGKVALLARLISGARVLGIETQRALLDRAPRLEGVEFVHADVRGAPLDEGTVFFLYNPFSGGALREVLERLHAVAQHHAIVVCALGIDVEHGTESWLRPRPTDAFWLQLFDSVVPGVPPRVVEPPRFDARLHRLAGEW